MTEVPPPRHAAPVVGVDRIIRFEQGGITTQKVVRAEEPYFKGHYPHFPIFPGVLTVDSADQAARLYAERFHGRIRLLEVKSRFLAAVRPGDVLECQLQCTLLEEGKRLKVDATCRNGSVVASSVKFIYEIEGPHGL